MSRHTEQAAGRRAALAALEEHLVAALRGRGRVVGIRGAAGSGRSEAALEFLRGCRERGLAISGVECLAHGYPATFVPGRALLRAILGISARDSADVAPDRVASALTTLDPGIETELPLLFDFLGIEDPGEHEPGPGDRHEPLLALVARIVHAAAGGVPQVLLVDDVDHADPGSAALIAAIAGAVDGSRVLLVTTAAPDHRAPWMDKPSSYAIDLVPGEAASRARPSVDALAGDESIVLGIGAAIGLHFSISMLHRACDLDDERLAAALYALQNGGLIRSRSRTPEARFAFVHPGVREAALSGLAPDARATSHGRIALAMEELEFERLDERAALIARHWEQAGERAAAARWHRHAAKCVAPWAPESAEAHRRRAEELGQRRPAGPPPR